MVWGGYWGLELVIGHGAGHAILAEDQRRVPGINVLIVGIRIGSGVDADPPGSGGERDPVGATSYSLGM